MSNKNTGENPRETVDSNFEAEIKEASETPTEHAPDTENVSVPTLEQLGIEPPAKTAEQQPVEIKIDKHEEIGSILQEDLREKLEGLSHGAKKDIIDSGRELRDRLYKGMNEHLFTDTELVEIIYDWLSKFNLGNAYTLTESRNRAERIQELFSN